MSAFVFAYRQSNGYKPSNESYPAWKEWFDGMGDHLSDLGAPVVQRATIGNCAPEATEFGGYSVIEADDLDSALTIAKGCPTMNRNGGVEVGLLGPVPA